MQAGETIQHQRSARNLGNLLWNYVQEHQLGEVFFAPLDVLLPPDATSVQPDIIFVAQARRDLITEKNITGAPDLLIEILSERTAPHDRITKFEMYEQAGVSEYWLVATHTIEVFVLVGGAYQSQGVFKAGQAATSQVVMGFTVTVNAVIAL